MIDECKSWRLRSGVKLHREHPDTFQIPSKSDKAAIQVGDFVKLIFDAGRNGTERMWVRVTQLHPLGGTLANSPVCVPYWELQWGQFVGFKRKHIINIESKAEVSA